MFNGYAHLTGLFIIPPCVLHAKTTLPAHKVITAFKSRLLCRARKLVAVAKSGKR